MRLATWASRSLSASSKTVSRQRRPASSFASSERKNRMRRDVFIANDSGGLSVIAADAADAIIQDARANDLRFVTDYKALLIELYGDDSMPVRIVVDEPLGTDEEAQWLSRASWRIDTTDGRLLVMGGFDPDVLAS